MDIKKDSRSIKDKKSKYSETTVSEDIESSYYELEVDCVGLWQLMGKGWCTFELRGSELDEYLKAQIIAMVNYGAVPVRSSEDKPLHDVWQKQYGSSAEEIAYGIVNELHRELSGSWDGGPEVGLGIYFTFPRKLNDIWLKFPKKEGLSLLRCQTAECPQVSIQEMIDKNPDSLKRDCINSDQVFDIGYYGLKLRGDHLEHFFRENIELLVQHGAIPVDLAPELPVRLVWLKRYGNRPEEISENIIKELHEKVPDLDNGMKKEHSVTLAIPDDTLEILTKGRLSWQDKLNIWLCSAKKRLRDLAGLA